jgi:hypothetical protein
VQKVMKVMTAAKKRRAWWTSGARSSTRTAVTAVPSSAGIQYQAIAGRRSASRSVCCCPSRSKTTGTRNVSSACASVVA